jgi:quinoprotein glucose dehydrogenase
MSSPEPASGLRPACIPALALFGRGLLLPLGCGPEIDFSGPVAGWPVYGSDLGGSRHCPLPQITPGNVDPLEVAWTYHHGDILDGKESPAPSTFQDTPNLFEDLLYLHLCTPFNRVVALDPETGSTS